MSNRVLILVLLEASIARQAPCDDVIVINNPRALGQLAVQLWQRYGYLVTYEEAPVDRDREVATAVYAADRIDKFAISKPVTFHVPRGKSAGANGQLDAGANAETILPLSQELIQPLVDEYNASGNPSKFAALARRARSSGLRGLYSTTSRRRNIS